MSDAEGGDVVQMSGDQRTNIHEFLVDQQICAASQVRRRSNDQNHDNVGGQEAVARGIVEGTTRGGGGAIVCIVCFSDHIRSRLEWGTSPIETAARG